MGRNSHKKHGSPKPTPKPEEHDDDTPQFRVINYHALRPQLHTLIEQEIVEDGRKSVVIFPHGESGQYQAEDEENLQNVLMIVPNQKVFEAKTIREMTFKGVECTIQYFLGYVLEKTADQTLTWDNPALQGEDLCGFRHKGFLGTIPPVLTGTQYCEPNLYYAVALIKRK